MTIQRMSKERKELIDELKRNYYNDYCVLTDSVIFGITARVYSDKEIAIKEQKRITKNCDMLKPCTIELIHLF